MVLRKVHCERILCKYARHVSQMFIWLDKNIATSLSHTTTTVLLNSLDHRHKKNGNILSPDLVSTRGCHVACATFSLQLYSLVRVVLTANFIMVNIVKSLFSPARASVKIKITTASVQTAKNVQAPTRESRKLFVSERVNFFYVTRQKTAGKLSLFLSYCSLCFII